MSLLLALTGSEPAPAPPPAAVSGGWPTLRRKEGKREKWREELDELFAEPVAVEVPQPEPAPAAKPVSVPLTRSQKAYFDGLYAEIVRAKNEQERAKKQALAASAAQEAAEAQTLLAEAIEAERVAKRRMMDFDIAFVASVLANA
jgi:hypothetical protein